jgi:hypothetical protein
MGACTTAWMSEHLLRVELRWRSNAELRCRLGVQLQQRLRRRSSIRYCIQLSECIWRAEPIIQKPSMVVKSVIWLSLIEEAPLKERTDRIDIMDIGTQKLSNAILWQGCAD